jgi:RNA recognition motif-containing protein
MPDDEQANEAIRAIHGMKFQGQVLRVNKSLSTRGHTNYRTR